MSTVVVKPDEDLSKALKRFQKLSAPRRKQVRRYEFFMSKKERRAVKRAKNRSYR